MMFPIKNRTFEQILGFSISEMYYFSPRPTVNSPFFCSEFESVSRIMKIVHSALVHTLFFDLFFLFQLTVYIHEMGILSLSVDNNSDPVKMHLRHRICLIAKSNFLILLYCVASLGAICLVSCNTSLFQFSGHLLRTRKDLIIYSKQ